MTLGHRRTLQIAAGLLLSTFAVVPKVRGQAAPAEDSPRGIFVGGTKLGVSAEVEIERDGKRGMVPSNFEFKSGDRFWLHVTVNKDSYVYVLNRTLTGSGAASRGIRLLAEEDRTAKVPPPDAYTLVFPPPNTSPQLVHKGTPTVVPGRGLYFGMDEVPGAEKVLVLASHTPINLANYFNPATGKLLPSGSRTDSVGTVLNRLNTELTQMADNAKTEEPAKTRAIAIIPDPRAPTEVPPEPKTDPTPPAPKPLTPAPAAAARQGGPATKAPVSSPAPERKTVAVVQQPGKPMLLELTLVHLAGERGK